MTLTLLKRPGASGTLQESALEPVLLNTFIHNLVGGENAQVAGLQTIPN